MLINYQKLKNLPVITQSGQLLGYITKIDIDIESQKIIFYYIKSTNFIKGLLEGELIIHKDQIISITKDKIIVDNRVLNKDKKRLIKIKTTERKII